MIATNMKPTVAADEMFPEGVGPYMDLEEDNEVVKKMEHKTRDASGSCVPDVARTEVLLGIEKTKTEAMTWNEPLHKIYQSAAGGASNLLMDLAANEKAVHADFFNDFDDLFDDDDLK